MDKINLRDLLIIDYDDLPEIVDAINCIYRIHNLINDKSYIGQTKWFYGRFAGPGFSHKDSLSWNETYLYNAIRKYKSRNFEVEILEKDLDAEDLNDREVYWISFYDTYHVNGKGYNLNRGGDNRENLHTPEVNNRRMMTNLERYGDPHGRIHTEESFETNRRNHGGVLAWNTEEAQIKQCESRAKRYNGDPYGQLHTAEAYETQIERYGCLAIHTPEAQARARESQIRIYGCLAINTPESRAKAMATKALKYDGDVMGQCHTPEAFENNRRNHGGILAWNTPIAKINSIKSIWFRNSSFIKEHLDFLGLELNALNYFNNSSWEHLDRLMDDYPRFKEDERWTEEYENLYRGLIQIPEMIERWNNDFYL